MPGTLKKHNYPGKLIAVEGLDGSGKSTQIYLAKRWLESQNLKVFFSEWNSSDLVRNATRKGKNDKLLTPTTFSLIHSTDFADRWERQIQPLLRAGYIVLCDRYMFTAFARDGVRGCDKQWLRDIYSIAPLPDLTFFFKLPLEVALSRILDGRPALKYFEAGMDMNFSSDLYESFKIFQGRIHEEYCSMANEFNFEVMEATAPIERQQEKMRQILADKINLPKFKNRFS
jgi:dTMP kinase